MNKAQAQTVTLEMIGKAHLAYVKAVRARDEAFVHDFMQWGKRPEHLKLELAVRNAERARDQWTEELLRGDGKKEK
jgi:hypothetical protein